MTTDERIGWWINQIRAGNRDGEIGERLKPAADLQPEFARLVIGDWPVVDILDIQCGPLTSLGNRLPGRKVRIRQLEPEAERLERLLSDCGIGSRGDLVAGSPETVQEIWPAPSFDLVVCRQAKWLADPAASLPALYAILRPGGALSVTVSFETAIGRPAWSLRIGAGGLSLCSDGEERPLGEAFFGDGAVVSWRATSGGDAAAAAWVTLEVRKPASRKDTLRRQLEDFSGTVAPLRTLHGVAIEGEDLDFIADFFARKPDGTAGSILPNDAAFLYAWMKKTRPKCVLEIGVSSGVSSAFFLESAERLGLLEHGFRLDSIDLLEHVYAAPDDKVGWVVEAMAGRLASRFNLLTGVTAFDVDRLIGEGKVHRPDLVFLDAEHAHPFPALDLAALCKVMEPDAWILLHDICLFERALRDSYRLKIRPDWMLRGVEWAFEFWPGEKFRGAGEHANVGAVRAVANVEATPAWRALTALPGERSLTPEAAVLLARLEGTA
ncbi:class I SAM-dependent methyltransferase [Stappia sp. WLB 29]|uniref:class I SAM-dependent methyltransferase n=1 Tax=Stappia sp. WLB 29 TaxID=2925220 RepID=UPI0020BDAA9B|nr:class I SAM-dependent methyltransferase [Stappia sp. WLB 29]